VRNNASIRIKADIPELNAKNLLIQIIVLSLNNNAVYFTYGYKNLIIIEKLITTNKHKTVLFKYNIFSFCSLFDNVVFCHITASHAPTIPKIIAETIKSVSKNGIISETEILFPRKNDNRPLRITRIHRTHNNFFFILVQPSVHLYMSPITLIILED